MDDLIERLRALARHEHSDMTIGDEAADALEAVREDAELAAKRLAKALEIAEKALGGIIEEHSPPPRTRCVVALSPGGIGAAEGEGHVKGMAKVNSEHVEALQDAAPPSAPVGVEGVEAALQKWLDWCNEHNEEPEAKSGARIAIEALAQQPAAVPGAETLRLHMGELTADEVRVAQAAYRLALAQAPPSAPVGVEGVEAALQKWLDWCNEHNEEPEARSGARIAIEALAQQSSPSSRRNAMTDIELLTLPEAVDVIFSPDGNGAALDVFTAEQVQDYARANVAHATDAKDAEIERLRAELREAWSAVDSKAGWEWKKRAEQAEARAERLAEALRRHRPTTRPRPGGGQWMT